MGSLVVYLGSTFFDSSEEEILPCPLNGMWLQPANFALDGARIPG